VYTLLLVPGVKVALSVPLPADGLDVIETDAPLPTTLDTPSACVWFTFIVAFAVGV